MSPRGQREAVVLQEAGYEVTLSGVWFDARMAEIDHELKRRLHLRFDPALDLRPRVAPLSRLLQRAKGRWARAQFARTQSFDPALLGPGVAAQLETALKINADLTIAHGEAGLWIAAELARRGRPVGIDFEDWFSRDLPESARRARPVKELAGLEGFLLKTATYRLASSRVMARQLGKIHGVSEPAVVTNAGAPRADSPARLPDGKLRLHWFSQTIGPARGLELLFQALPRVKSPVQITLRGACSPANRAWLQRIVPPDSRPLVKVEPPVAPWELAARVAEHDVGLVLETSEIESRDLCIPNKYFQFLASGLAVIATQTSGLNEALAPCPEAGIFVQEKCPQSLADAIDLLAANSARLSQARAAARLAGEAVWNGDHEREVLITEAWRAVRA